MEPLLKNGRSLLNRLLCVNVLSRQKNRQKFEVTTAKEINRYEMFCSVLRGASLSTFEILDVA